MSFAHAFSAYLSLNLMLIVGLMSLAFISLAMNRLGFCFRARSELKLHYSSLLLILGLVFIHPLLPGNNVFSPPLKVWSAQNIASFHRDYVDPSRGGYLSLPAPNGASTYQVDEIASSWAVLSLVVILVGGVILYRDLRALIAIKRNSFLIRKLGRVRIFVSDSVQVPFSFWLPGRANVVIPSYLIERREDFKLAVAHELQHHRQGDTRWVYLMWGVKLVCFMNPAIHFWNRWISEIQEFACDEALVDQKKVESRAYARCLIEVAQTAVGQKQEPVCATGLAFLVRRNFLKRRIERMFSKTNPRIGRFTTYSIALLLALLIGTTAFASKGLIQDRRVSMAQAQAMALRAQSETGFPIVVNDLVLKQLNRYIGTPEGREFMRSSLARMENYKAVVGGYLQKYGMPVELMAIPIIETGYKNLSEKQSNTPMRAAGLWQFIPQTARNYGLRVDNHKDERLEVSLATDAALRFLLSNYLRFKDWQLAVLAYNMGENAVQKGLTALGTRDAWELIRNGHEGDRDYLSRFMAAVLIMKNPESVQ